MTTIEIKTAKNGRLICKRNGKRESLSKLNEEYAYGEGNLSTVEAIILDGHKYTNLGWGSAVNSHPLDCAHYAFVDETGDYFDVGGHIYAAVDHLRLHLNVPEWRRNELPQFNYYAAKAKADEKRRASHAAYIAGLVAIKERKVAEYTFAAGNEEDAIRAEYEAAFFADDEDDDIITEDAADPANVEVKSAPESAPAEVKAEAAPVDIETLNRQAKLYAVSGKVFGAISEALTPPVDCDAATAGEYESAYQTLKAAHVMFSASRRKFGKANREYIPQLRQLAKDAVNTRLHKASAQAKALFDAVNVVVEAEVARLQEKSIEISGQLGKLDAAKHLLTAAEFDAKAGELNDNLRYVNLQIDALNAGDNFDYVNAAEHIASVYYDAKNFVYRYTREDGLTQEQCENIYATVYSQCDFGNPDFNLIDRLIKECKRKNAESKSPVILTPAQIAAAEIVNNLGNVTVKFAYAGEGKNGGLALHYETFNNPNDEFSTDINIVEVFTPESKYILDHVNVIKGYGDDKQITKHIFKDYYTAAPTPAPVKIALPSELPHIDKETITVATVQDAWQIVEDRFGDAFVPGEICDCWDGTTTAVFLNGDFRLEVFSVDGNATMFDVKNNDIRPFLHIEISDWNRGDNDDNDTPEPNGEDLTKPEPPAPAEPAPVNNEAVPVEGETPSEPVIGAEITTAFESDYGYRNYQVGDETVKFFYGESLMPTSMLITAPQYGATLYHNNTGEVEFHIRPNRSGNGYIGEEQALNADEFFKVMAERGACTVDAQPPTPAYNHDTGGGKAPLPTTTQDGALTKKKNQL